MEFTKWGVLGAIAVGLAVGTLMSMITEYYTAMGKRPVMSIIRQSSTGHATNVIGGLAVGMESTCLPILVLAAGIWGAYCLCRFIRSCHCRCRYDGNHGHATGY